MRRFRDALVVLLAALAAAAGFHDPRWAPLQFVAFVPLFAALGISPSTGDALKTAYLFGFAFFLSVSYPMALVTVPGWVLSSAYLALYPAAAAAAFRPWIDPSAELDGTVFRRSLRGVFFIPSIWTLAEWVRSNLFSGLPLGIIGHAQWKNVQLIQCADTFGVWGVSWFVLFSNAALFKLLKEASGSRRAEDALSRGSRRRYLTLLAAIFTASWALALGYGAWRLIEWDTFYRSPAPKAVLRVSVVQGNVPQEEKWDRRIKNIIFEKYKRLSFMCAVEKSDLIVWPETSFPGFLEDEPLMSAHLRSLVRHSRAEALIGAPTIGDVTDRGVRFYNSAIHFGPDGEERRRYSKMHLVPFGEYLPLEPLLGFIRAVSPPIGDFSPGEEFTIFEARSRHRKTAVRAKFATLICYEDMFPSLTRDFVRHGANFLVNVTNDAWFGKTSAPYQHGQASTFRAVENRGPLVRAANTGWSAFIDATGRTLSSVEDNGEEIFVTGYRAQDITLRRVTSLYTRFGELFIVLLWGVAAFAYFDHSKHHAYSRV